jgi:hypothetical protein
LGGKGVGKGWEGVERRLGGEDWKEEEGGWEKEEVRWGWGGGGR